MPRTINYFGKQLNHFFNKNNYWTSIKLVESDAILIEDEKIPKEVNNSFQNPVSNLNIQENPFTQRKHYHNLPVPLKELLLNINNIQVFYQFKARYSIDMNFPFQQSEKLMFTKKLKTSTQEKLLSKTISLQEYWKTDTKSVLNFYRNLKTTLSLVVNFHTIWN